MHPIVIHVCTFSFFLFLLLTKKIYVPLEKKFSTFFLFNFFFNFFFYIFYFHYFLFFNLFSFNFN